MMTTTYPAKLQKKTQKAAVAERKRSLPRTLAINQAAKKTRASPYYLSAQARALQILRRRKEAPRVQQVHTYAQRGPMGYAATPPWATLIHGICRDSPRSPAAGAVFGAHVHRPPSSGLLKTAVAARGVAVAVAVAN
jgi:hypothetical protein